MDDPCDGAAKSKKRRKKKKKAEEEEGGAESQASCGMIDPSVSFCPASLTLCILLLSLLQPTSAAAPQELLAPSSRKQQSSIIAASSSSHSEFAPFCLRRWRSRSSCVVVVAGEAQLFIPSPLHPVCREVPAGGRASQSSPEEKGPQGDMKCGRWSAWSLCKRWLIVSHAIINTYRSFFSEFHKQFMGLWLGRRVTDGAVIGGPAWTELSELICTKCFSAVSSRYLYFFIPTVDLVFNGFPQFYKSGFNFIHDYEETCLVLMGFFFLKF